MEVALVLVTNQVPEGNTVEADIIINQVDLKVEANGTNLNLMV
jgi:hypothetical protein